MKALIISDKQEIIDSLKDYLTESNYDIIVYRWLLKALDNIEEIQPDLIFLSASEYPRHWKTLASFVQSGIGGNDVKLYLYDPDPLSEEEKNKAKSLGIESFVDSLSIDELKKILPNTETVIKNTATKFELVFTHPLSGKLIFGNAENFKDSDLYYCNIDVYDSKLEVDTFIRFVSVYSKNELKSFEAVIVEKDDDNKKLVLKVKEYYEEEI